MSGEPELAGDDALAAEHALGVLGGRERAAAEARMAADPAFAAAVEDWRARLAPLGDEVAPVPPPASLWPSIERRLPANDDGRLAGAVRLWRGLALGGLALAAAGLVGVVVMANRPPVLLNPPAAAPAALLNASLKGESGPPMFVAAYDPMRGALIITSLVPPGGDPDHAHELWLIPADGKPRALGMIEPGASKQMPMAHDLAPMIAEGAALAVSIEPPGGSPMPGPSGPVAATGKFEKI